MMHWKTSLLVLICLMPIYSLAQTNEEVRSLLSSLRERSESLDRFSCDVKYEVFSESLSSIPIEKNTSEYYIFDDHFLFRNETVQMVQDDSLMLSIDKEGKSAFLTSNKEIRGVFNETLGQYEAVYEQMKIDHSKSTSDRAVLTIDPDVLSDYTLLELVIDLEKMILVKVTVGVKDFRTEEVSFMTISYENIALDRNVKDRKLDVDASFLSIKEGEYILSSPYQDYQLLSTVKPNSN